jgi:hypothetical protein
LSYNNKPTGLDMFTEIKAQIERITYYNEENGYTIAKAGVGGMVTRARTFAHL